MRRVANAISSIAASKAGVFARDGCVEPPEHVIGVGRRH
jgi:hypothetical protein